MKTKILTIALSGILAALSFTAIAQEDKKAAEARKDVAEANKDVMEAKEDLREAKIDSAADFQEFKKASELKIAENHKQITALKSKKSNDTKAVRAKYDEKVLALEHKNNALKMQIRGSGITKTSKWTSFKREFNHDVNELGRAIADLGKDNAK